MFARRKEREEAAQGCVNMYFETRVNLMNTSGTYAARGACAPLSFSPHRKSAMADNRTKSEFFSPHHPSSSRASERAS